MDFSCPVCNSENIQRLSVVYEGGLSYIDTTTSGMAAGYGNGAGGAGSVSARTTGTSQTTASQRAAPPPQKGYLWPLVLIGFAALVLSWLNSVFIDPPSRNDLLDHLIGLTWMASSVAAIYFIFQYNSTTWRQLKAAWDNSFVCNRCHEIFRLDRH
jgi:hypothetical protein